jgi:hypothetical protein
VSRLKTMASNAAVQLGPPPRSFADDAHDCIMVRSEKRIDRIQGCGATSAPGWRTPPRIGVVPIFRLQDYSCLSKGEVHNNNPQYLEQRRIIFVQSLYVAATIMMSRPAHSPSSPAPSARRKRLWGLTAQRSRARGLSMPQMQSCDVTK